MLNKNVLKLYYMIVKTNKNTTIVKNTEYRNKEIHTCSYQDLISLIKFNKWNSLKNRSLLTN